MELEQRQIFSIPRALVLGTSVGVGVSTIVLGLLVALKRAGVSVASGVVGGSLVQATHQRRILSRLTHSLDPLLLSADELVSSMVRLCSGAEFLVLEGEGAVLDQLSTPSAVKRISDVANLLGAPVILVFDASGSTESAVAGIDGIRKLGQLQIAGVIANRVRDASQNERLRAAVENLGGIVYLGGVRVDNPNLGLEQLSARELQNPSLLPRNRILGIGNALTEAVSIDQLKELAEYGRALEISGATGASLARHCRVAVADDAAFHLTIQDNLDLIRRAGGELVAFSPLADRKLPSRISGIYLPGGYSHLYASDIQFNREMLKAIATFAAYGGVIYAEAGSAAFLSKKMVLSTGEEYTMSGVLPTLATATIDESRLPLLLPCEIVSQDDTVISSMKSKMRGLLDSRWYLQSDEGIGKLLEYQILPREAGLSSPPPKTFGGLSPSPNILVSAAHIHWGSHPQIAERFIGSLRSVGETPEV